MKNSGSAPSTVVRTTANRMMRVIGRKSMLFLVALCIGSIGLPLTVHADELSMQRQIATLQSQLEQQQRMMEQQQLMIEKMQRQFDEQKVARKQLMRKGKKIKQQAEEAESTAQVAQSTAQEAQSTAQGAVWGTQKIAHIEGIDLSKEMEGFYPDSGMQIGVPKTDTVLTISGFIMAQAIHDFDQISSPYKFVAKDIIVDGQIDDSPDSQTTFTANPSRLVIGSTTPLENTKLTTFLSMDFAGNTTSSAADLRLRQAWGQLDNLIFGGDLRFGQAWTSWDDLAALPETMDFEGPNGSQQKRQPLVRWSRDYGEKYTLWLSLENPDYNFTDGDIETRWPDTVISLNWHGDWGHIKPALIGRDLKGESDNGDSDSAFGWGAQLAGKLMTPWLNEKDNFKFQVVYGDGVGSYNNDGGYDDALFKDNGDLNTISSFQWFAAYQHWWTKSLRSNAVFGMVDVDNETEQSEDSLDRTIYAAANLVWSPVKQIDFGIEYVYGERRDKSRDDGSASRILASAKYKF